MALTPDEIERRTFPIADWGYDRGDVHKFLVEVAATLRYAQHASVGSAPGVILESAPPPPSAATIGVAVGEGGRPDLSQVGDHVAQILAAAEALAAGLRTEAEQQALAIRAEAEQAAADRRREADADIEHHREQARRVLVAAQDQATRIVAEAEEHALALRNAAEERSRARSERLARVAQQHADRVVRYERDAVLRLEAAQGDLRRAIERLVGSDRSPVLDLTDERPAVRVGNLPGEVGDPVSPAPDQLPVDPVNSLVRAAVERAVEHSTGSGS